MGGGGMDGGAEEERLARVEPCPGTVPSRRHLEMASLPLPDELLAEILLRLPPFSADLARASATSVSFRRVAAHRSFLRRYRKLHGLPLLGFLERPKAFYPAIAPHPAASAASVVAWAADFSFSFLPAPARDWVIRDVRDGRVVLNRWYSWAAEAVVCDPLHRRYLPLPAPPYDPATLLHVEIFLVPPGCGVEAASADETSFRVISMAQCKTRLVAFVFSSNTRQWRAIQSRCWTDLSAGLPPSPATTLFYLRQYVCACFYWLTADPEESKLLLLDTETMEFSIAVPPPEANSCCDFAMVEAGEGRPGMFVLAENTCDLSYFIRQNDGVSQWWQKVKTISLGSCTRLICNMDKYLLLHYRQSSLLEPGCFTLDIETFQLEMVCPLGSTFNKLHAYSNFPPSLLSSPIISSGVEEGPKKEMLEQGCATSSSAESPWSSSAGANAGDLAVLQDQIGW